MYLNNKTYSLLVLGLALLLSQPCLAGPVKSDGLPFFADTKENLEAAVWKLWNPDSTSTPTEKQENEKKAEIQLASADPTSEISRVRPGRTFSIAELNQPPAPPITRTPPILVRPGRTFSIAELNQPPAPPITRTPPILVRPGRTLLPRPEDRMHPFADMKESLEAAVWKLWNPDSTSTPTEKQENEKKAEIQLASADPTSEKEADDTTEAVEQLAVHTDPGQRDDEDYQDFESSFVYEASGSHEKNSDADAATLKNVHTDQPVAQNRRAHKNQPTITELALNDQLSQTIRLTVGSSKAIELDATIDLADISDPQIADVLIPSPHRVIVVGKAVGNTLLNLKMGETFHLFRIAVEPDYQTLKELIQSVSQLADVSVRTLKGRLVLMGSAPDAESIRRIVDLATVFQGEEIVNQLSVAGVQQTLLRVTVAEVNKKALRSLGINWAVGGSALSRDFFLANNLGQLNPTVFSSTGLLDVTRGQQLFSVLPTGNGPNTNITFGFPRAELQFFLNALRENNLARTLAEPNLVAISGQTATFLAGGEVPVPVTQGGAVAGAITIEYKEFGIRLAFTPTVVGGQVIRIHVMTEVSDAIPENRLVGGLPVFTFTTRRVESTIECGNGQTFAIAGLMNEKVESIISKIPGLGDLPVLGALFSSVDYQRSNTELVVLVTPQLVEPLQPGQIPPLPGSKMTHPTDYELFALQKVEGTTPSEGIAEGNVDAQSQDQGGTLAVSHNSSWPKLIGTWGIEDPDEKALQKN